MARAFSAEPPPVTAGLAVARTVVRAAVLAAQELSDRGTMEAGQILLALPPDLAAVQVLSEQRQLQVVSGFFPQ